MQNVERSIEIDCGAERVFSALTSSRSVSMFWPIEHAEIGAGEEEAILLRGAGFEDRGTITRYVPNRQFAYEYWSTNHGTIESRENRVTLSYRLTEENGRTVLTVVQRNLPSDEWAEQMLGIWDQLLQALKKHLEAGND